LLRGRAPGAKVLPAGPMPMLRRAFLALAAFALAGRGLAATPTKQDALEAISVMEKSVAGPAAASAAKTIVIYAQLSDDVMVNIGPDQLPWVDEKWDLAQERIQSCQALLMAAFVAGNIKSQIKNDHAEDDTYSGWIFAIDTYRRLKAAENFVSPAIEALAKLQAEGKLLQHAREVHPDPNSADPADTPARPLAAMPTWSGSPA
jgi:hypothetical protein